MHSLNRFLIFHTVLSFCVVLQPATRSFPADTSTFASEPILSRPTNNSVTISIVPQKGIELYYEYGTSPGNYFNTSETLNTAANSSVRIVLTNLLPDTRYYYRLRYRVPGQPQFLAGEPGTFVTKRRKGSPFNFAILADSHMYDKKGNSNAMTLTMQNILSANPDMIIDLGDTFGDDHKPTTITQQQMMQLHKDLLPYFGIACRSAHLFLCIGNHEGENGYYLLQNPPENIAVYGTLARKFYYANPYPNEFYSGNNSAEGFGIGLPENYYSWEWGDALFVVLDVYRHYTVSAKPEGWDWTIGYQQYEWFRQTLQNSSAKYKFVFAHHLRGQGRGGVVMADGFEWGGYDGNGTWGFNSNRAGWAMPIHQLMKTYNVNAFFQGHDHLFAMEKLDNIFYQETPMPSDSTYTIGMLANADAYLSNQLDGTGYLNVKISPDNAAVEYVRTYLPADTDAVHRNGGIAFAYSLVSPQKIDQDTILLPNSAELLQNYPNPFNSSTLIKFILNKDCYVKLDVFNLLGEKTASLVDEFKTAGSYSVRFTLPEVLRNTNLQSSGAYIYKLQAGSSAIVKKMLFLK